MKKKQAKKAVVAKKVVDAKPAVKGVDKYPKIAK